MTALVASLALMMWWVPHPRAVLARVSGYYAGVSSYEAKLRVKSHEVRDGTLRVQRPFAFHIDIYKKTRTGVVVERTQIFDGTSYRSIDHSQNTTATSLAPPVEYAAGLLFLTTTTWSDVTVEYETSGRFGDVVLELTPTSTRAFQRLWLVTEPSNWRVTRAVVLDAGGELHELSFYEPRLGP